MEERSFELEEDPKMSVKYSGEEYQLRYPSSLELAEMTRIEKGMTGGNVDFTSAFKAINKHLVDLGMPKDVVSKLPHTQITSLLEFIYDRKQKKS